RQRQRFAAGSGSVFFFLFRAVSHAVLSRFLNSPLHSFSASVSRYPREVRRPRRPVPDQASARKGAKSRGQWFGIPKGGQFRPPSPAPWALEAGKRVSPVPAPAPRPNPPLQSTQRRARDGPRALYGGSSAFRDPLRRRLLLRSAPEQARRGLPPPPASPQSRWRRRGVPALESPSSAAPTALPPDQPDRREPSRWL